MKDYDDVKQAWSAYFSGTKVSDLDALRKEGWLTANEIAEIKCIPAEKCRKRLSHDESLDSKPVRIIWRGSLRTMLVFRPKSLSLAPKTAKV